MKLLRRHSSKSTTHIDVVLLVEDLSPWPAHHGTLAVQWTRGKRAGHTRPTAPVDEDASIASYTFGDTLTIPATLYRQSDGSFEEKKLSLYVAQVDDKGKELNVLAATEINLADFGALKGRVRQSYSLDCSGAVVSAAGGRPALTLSIAVARSGEAAPVLGDAAADEEPLPSTLSTEIEDSRQSAQDSRAETVSRPEGGRQPLQSVAEGSGDAEDEVEGEGEASVTRRSAPETSHAPQIGRRSEEYDSDGFLVDSDLATGHSASGAVMLTGLTSRPPPVKEDSADTSTVKRNLSLDIETAAGPGGGGSGGGGVNDDASTEGGAGEPSPEAISISQRLPEPSQSPSEHEEAQRAQQAQQGPVHMRRFSRSDGSALGSRRWAWKQQGGGGGAGVGDSAPTSPVGAATPPSPAGLPDSPAAGLAGTAAAAASSLHSPSASQAHPGLSQGYTLTGRSYGTATADGGAVSAATSPKTAAAAAADRELQTAAALESAVYLAGRGWAAPRRPPRLEQLQAPARRLARTVLILGPDEGTAFGRRAIAAIRAAATASLGDPHRLMLWWANAVTLRWSFWALERNTSGLSAGAGGDELPSPGQGHLGWAAKALGPALRHLEAQLYGDLIGLLWSGVVVPAAAAAAAEARGSDGGPSFMRTFSNGSARSAVSVGPVAADDGEEGAAGHWLRGLKAAEAALGGSGRPPPAPRPLLALLRRQALMGLMARMDRVLVESLLADDVPGSPGSARVAAATAAAAELHLPPELLLCHVERGGRLTFEAGVQLKMAAGRLVGWAADAGVREGPEVRVFPRLREVADLLMVPKATLDNEEVRRTVAPSLSPAAVARTLQRYQAEEGSSDALPPALIKQLRAESAGRGGPRAEAASGAVGEAYVPPAEEALLDGGFVQPLSLEVSADSDEELEGLEERGERRFRLLRELWSAVM